VKAVNSGTLKIGATALTATAWAAGTNDVVDTTHQVFWKPAANANGTLDAFTVAAKDNAGAESTPPVQAQITVRNVNDLPTGDVTISGTAAEGQTLTASNTLADIDGLGRITYSWLANGTAVGTGNSYTLTSNEVGKAMTVTANYIDLLGTAESKTSVPTSIVITSSPGFIVTTVDSFTAEDGDTALISIQLATAPTRDVSISFASNDLTEGKITSATTLTFNNSNWSTAQTITVTGVNDYDYDGNQPYNINAIVRTSDVNYQNILITPIVITNKEDLTTVSNLRIPVGIPRDMPLSLIGDAIVDSSRLDTLTGLFQVVGTLPSRDVLQGLDGSDTLNGGYLQDDLSGGLGNDLLYGGYDNDFLYGEDGNDLLKGEEGADSLLGGAGDDILMGGVDDLMVDTMTGGAGNDTYYLGYSAIDIVIDSGLAADVDTVIMPYNLSSYTLPTGIEKGTIEAGTLASNLIGNSGNNTLTGNDGKNQLSGGLGKDTLIGGNGNDILKGDAGLDSMDGGSGSDTYYLGNDAIVDVIADSGTSLTEKDAIVMPYQLREYTLPNNIENGQITTMAVIKLVSLATVSGSFDNILTGNGLNNALTGNNGNNQILGLSGNDTLNGNAGNDSLDGSDGNDTVVGGDGNDTLAGGAGNDSLVGGVGSDRYIVESSTDKVIETSTLAIEIDSVESSVTWVLNNNVENLILTGVSAINGTGNNLANSVIGNSAANVLNGSAGNDTLTGGAGSDVFQLTSLSNDTITDFSVVDDTIQLENAVFSQLTATGTLNIANFKIGLVAADANDFVIYNSVTGVLFYDADGSGVGGATQIAVLGIGLALTNADFVVI
jgi:Ca2+-binding RTX toxin-like protein